MTSTDGELFILEAWQQAVQMAWSLAKAERIAELNGSRSKTFDTRGLHPYSVEWGRILAFEVLMPELAHARYEGQSQQIDMVTMRKLAHQEGYDEWVREQVERALAEGQPVSRKVQHDCGGRAPGT